MSQSQDKYVCRRVVCELCPYEYCIDGEDMDEAMMVVAGAKQKKDIENLDARNVYSRRYRERHTAKENARVKKWQAENNDRNRQTQQRYRNNNKEPLRERQRKLRESEEFRESQRLRNREYYAKNKDQILEQARLRYRKGKGGKSA